VVKLTCYLIYLLLLHCFYYIIIGLGLNKMTFLARAQRDLNFANRRVQWISYYY
jgi:hypothetical protein